MIYKTKADLLGKMWKSRSDVRLVDRMVHRGEIKKVDGWYEVNEKFFIKWLNEYDKNMIQEDIVYDKNITLPVQNSDKTKELTDDLDFQIAENERLIKEHEAELDWVIERCFSHMAQHRCLPYPTKKEFIYWAKGVSMEWIDSDFSD